MSSDETVKRSRAWSGLPPWLRVAIGCGCFLLITGAVFVVAYAASRLAPLMIALAAAVLIAALLEPVMNLLRRARMPRALSAFIAVILLLMAFVAPIVLLWTVAAGQYDELAQRLRDGVQRLRTGASQVLPISDAQVNQILDDVQDRFQVGTNAVAGALTLAEIAASVVLALFVAFFLLKDGPVMWAWLLDEVPGRMRPVLRDVGPPSWDTLTRYIRGILIVAVIDAIGIGIALALIGVPFVIPLALLVLMGGFIPYVGSTISGGVAVLVALAANGPIDALLTLAAVIAVQQIEGNLLEPFIVGHQVRLHPVAVIVAVFAGALIAGVAGAVVAVPLAAVGYRIRRVLRARRIPGPVPAAADASPPPAVA